jgi:formyltetrahydrofolate deformylase
MISADDSATDAQRRTRGVNGLSGVARLTVQCADRPGIVAAVGRALAESGANILALDQFTTDPKGGTFTQRTVFQVPALQAAWPDLEAAVATHLGKPFEAHWQLHDAAIAKRVAIFVSKTDHCLLDLLWRHRRGDLAMNVVMVVSNHPDLAEEVRAFGIPFFYLPVGSDKSAAEKAQLELLIGNVDLIVLARYMQILSEDFLEEADVPIINIHHSFLPAFIGAAAYQKAKERGVKLVGATAHYVTKELDQGPIIEQDVVRVGHALSTAQLTKRGADVERQVLSRAVAWHCEDRVIRVGNTTVVFPA